MKEHILSSYSSKIEKLRVNSYYDFETQLSYCEKDFVNKIISKGVHCGTIHTFTVEASDPDEIVLGSTTVTKTLEASDPDETVFGSTLATETLEVSDVRIEQIEKIFIIEGTIQEFSEGNTDRDEFII